MAGTVLTPEQRRSRALGAKQWIASAAVPVPVRGALAKLADATADESTSGVARAFESVIAVTASQLDQGARSELARLAQMIVA